MFKYIKNKISNIKFKKKLESNKRRIFIDTREKKESFFKKRKKTIIKIPDFSVIFTKHNLKRIVIISWVSLSIIWIFSLFSPFFNLKTVEIYNIWDNALIDMNIAYTSIEKFRDKNMFLLSKSNIKTSIINYQKNINYVTIKKYPLDKKIVIKLNSIEWLFYTTINWKKYIITKNWVFIPTNNSWKKYSELNIIFSKEGEFINRIIDTKEQLKSNILWIKIKSITYFEKERELHIDLENNLKLIFDIDSDTEEQIEKIAIYNKEQKNISKPIDLYYIDLRVPNKLYYCENEMLNICRENLIRIYPYAPLLKTKPK